MRKIDTKPETTYTDNKILWQLLHEVGGEIEFPEEYMNDCPSFGAIVWIERKNGLIKYRREISTKTEIHIFNEVQDADTDN